MVRKLTLKQLQRAVGNQKIKLKNLEDRERLEKELSILKKPKTTNFGGRVGRGFVILSKKAGKAAMNQARAIKERQVQQQKRIKKGKKRNEGFDPLGSLDF